MKKITAVLCIALMLIMAFSTVVFAGDALEVTNIYPADGEEGLQPQNMAIKVRFSDQMAENENNNNKFVVKDVEGQEYPFQLVYSEKYPDEAWVILEGDLASDTEYTVTVKPGVQSVNGLVSTDEITSGFKTRNVQTDTTISMVLTMVMMGFMIFMTTRSAKKQAAEKDPLTKERMELAKLNPYKLAKEKNISVDEAKKEIEAEKVKLAKKIQKAEEEKKKQQEVLRAEMKRIEAEMDAEEEAARHAANYQVKAKGSLVAHGKTVPRSIVKANKAKRAAAEKAAKKQSKK